MRALTSLSSLFICLMLLSKVGTCNIISGLSSDFQQSYHWTGMDYTVALRFSQQNSHVFAADKTGKIRMYESINAPEWQYTIVLDVSDHTYRYVSLQ